MELVEQEYMSDSDDLYYDDSDIFEVQAEQKTNNSKNLSVAKKYGRQQINEQFLSKFTSKINLDDLDIKIPQQSQQVKNEIKQNLNYQAPDRKRDKKDRATVEQVLDNRTRVILAKFLNNEIITQINGCISTGKEANVYHSFNGLQKEFAVKIYKTSILVFKDRERYVDGEFRFRRGYCKSNPRKMVQLWAEKEFRNLKRIYQSEIKCPEPIVVKSNVLIMQFLGDNGDAAPRLKDAVIEDYSVIYNKVLRYIILFHECKLIHADLSEYNLLYYQEEVIMIDVSQSIEHDHPQALDFLKRDILNVNDFFNKRGLNTYSVRQIFDFIVDFTILKDNIDQFIQQMPDNRQKYDEQSDSLFIGSFIPRTLNEMDHTKLEDEVNKMFANQNDIYYDKLTGLQQNKNDKISNEQEEQQKQDKASSESDENDSGSEKEEKEQEVDDKKKGGWTKYDGMTKQERKQTVKADKREKRKDKIPKHIKKKHNKNSK